MHYTGLSFTPTGESDISNQKTVTPPPNTPAPFNTTFAGMTDGTGVSTASKNLAWTYNMVAAEIANTILAAGLVLDQDNWAQLQAAVKQIATTSSVPVVITGAPTGGTPTAQTFAIDEATSTLYAYFAKNPAPPAWHVIAKPATTAEVGAGTASNFVTAGTLYAALDPATAANNLKTRLYQQIQNAFNCFGTPAPMYATRAYATFNGNNPVTISESGNVSSIVRVSAGQYTVNFLQPFATNTYMVDGSAGSWGYRGFIQVTLAFKTTTSCRVVFVDVNGGFFDQQLIHVSFTTKG